jgi:hypothetical protein
VGSGTAAIGVFPYTAFGDTFLNTLGANRFIYPRPEGDIGFNIDFDSLYSFSNPGSAAFYVTLHEIGHTLGLKHSHDRGLAELPTFAEAGLQELDSAYATVMSYNPASPVIPEGHSATPMPLDILAIQYLYGANPTTGAGNTVYALADDAVVRTIYDVGGTDTLTATFSSQPVIIDLREATFSLIGARTAVATAFGTIIENAEGSQAADTIIGNQVANQLNGQAGDDAIAGQDGSDFLFGESGDDIIYGNKNTDHIDGGQGNDTLFGGQNNGVPSGTPLAQRDGFDTVSGGVGDDIMYGNHGADILVGGDGADVLFGGQDSDTLSGSAGNDELYGNLGADVFAFSKVNEGADSIHDFTTGEDVLALDAGASIAAVGTIGSDVLIELTGGTTIQLLGVASFDPALSLIA